MSVRVSRTILAAEAEAKRFLSKVGDLKRRAADLNETGYGTKEHAAVKRSSMDLSRALTAIRRTR